MTGIGFALCCLVFTAGNDFVFKLYARKTRSKGLFVAMVGVVWLAALSWLPRASTGNPAATMLWGAVSGLFSVGGNLLLIEAMSRQSVGFCSFVYRLNMVLVVIGAVLLLGESPGAAQYGGIVLATGAIILFGPKDAGDRRLVRGGVALLLAAAGMRAGMGLSYKYGFMHGADRNMVTIINSVFWIVGGVLYALWRERDAVKIDRKLLSYGLLSGLLVAGIVFFMAASLYRGDAAVVLPIAQMSFLLTFALGAVILKERFTRRHIAALVCGTAGIVLLSL